MFTINNPNFLTVVYEEFKDTKGLIRIRKLKNYIQHSGQTKKEKGIELNDGFTPNLGSITIDSYEFLDLDISIYQGKLSTRIYDKRDDCFLIVNFPILDGDKLLVQLVDSSNIKLGYGKIMVFNATFNNMSIISWRSVLLVEGTGVPGENHRPAASH